MDKTTGVVIIIGVGVWILKNIVWDWLQNLRNGKNGGKAVNINPNGSIHLDPNVKKTIYDTNMKVCSHDEKLKDLKDGINKLVEQGIESNLYLKQMADRK